MNNRVLFPILCLSLAVNLSFGGLYAYAKWNDDTNKGQRQRPMSDERGADEAPPNTPPCILDELDLDPKQNARLQELRKTVWQKRSRYFATMAELRRRIGETIAQGRGPATPAQEKLLQELLQSLCKKQSAFRQVVIHHLFDVKKLLGDQQRSHFARLLKTKIFRGMSRGQGHRGRP